MPGTNQEVVQEYLPDSYNVLLTQVGSESQRLAFTQNVDVRTLVVGQIVMQTDTGDIFMWDGTEWNNIGSEKITNETIDLVKPQQYSRTMGTRINDPIRLSINPDLSFTTGQELS